MHGDTCNGLLALLVLYIPSGISKQVWFICCKSAIEVVYTLACIGSKQFVCLFREPQALCRGYIRNSQLALLAYTHFLKIQIVLINCLFKQSKSLLCMMDEFTLTIYVHKLMLK